MGHCSSSEWQHPEDGSLKAYTQEYHLEGFHELGHWSNFVHDDHVRVIVENLGNNRYCTRSLMRSVLHFETIEELEEAEYWKGRLYQVTGGVVTTLARSEEVGDTEFRRLYRSLGGAAKW